MRKLFIAITDENDKPLLSAVVVRSESAVVMECAIYNGSAFVPDVFMHRSSGNEIEIEKSDPLTNAIGAHSEQLAKEWFYNFRNEARRVLALFKPKYVEVK